VRRLVTPFTDPPPSLSRRQTDLAPHVGASLEVMKRDADLMRDNGPTQFTSIRNGEGVEACVELILGAYKVAMAGGGGGKGKGKATTA